VQVETVAVHAVANNQHRAEAQDHMLEKLFELSRDNVTYFVQLDLVAVPKMLEAQVDFQVSHKALEPLRIH
jgi:hypothetical protein